MKKFFADQGQFFEFASQTVECQPRVSAVEGSATRILENFRILDWESCQAAQLQF